MNRAKVISVNPAHKTLGSMLEAGLAPGTLGRRILASTSVTPRTFPLVSVLLGVGKNTGKSFSRKLLAIRFVIGSILIAVALCTSTGYMSLPAIMATVAGASAIIGFLTRPVTAAAAVIAGRQAVLAAIGGTIDETAIFSALLYATIAITGPGLFSIDALMCKKTTRKTNPVPRPDAMSYKAYLTE